MKFVIVKEVMTCDVSPVVMFVHLNGLSMLILCCQSFKMTTDHSYSCPNLKMTGPSAKEEDKGGMEETDTVLFFHVFLHALEYCSETINDKHFTDDHHHHRDNIKGPGRKVQLFPSQERKSVQNQEDVKMSSGDWRSKPKLQKLSKLSTSWKIPSMK